MKKERKKGFTLLETIVSVAVFTIVMIIFVMIITTSLKIKLSSEGITNRHNIAAISLEGTGGTPTTESLATTFTINFSTPSKTITVNGSYIKSQLNGTKYIYFKPY